MSNDDSLQLKQDTFSHLIQGMNIENSIQGFENTKNGPNGDFKSLFCAIYLGISNKK